MATAFAAVHSDPDILGGKPVFAGTRVPFQTLVDYVAAGHTLNQFLDDFPTVSPAPTRTPYGGFVTITEPV
jgi:uncharacterized protein (DUF433 family)